MRFPARFCTLAAATVIAGMIAFTSLAQAQCSSGSCAAPEVAASRPFSQAGEIVVASQENLVPLSPQQLTDLGYSLRSDQATGRSYWAKAVSQPSSSGQVLSRPGECADGSCGSSTVLQLPGGS